MKIQTEYLNQLTIGQLMVFFPDNDVLFHDSGVWNISFDHQEAVSDYNEDLRELLISYISKHEFVDEVEIGCLKYDAEKIKEQLTKEK